MGESFYVCCDCKQGTSTYHSNCCEGCEERVCNGCTDDHKNKFCDDLENYATCEACSSKFKNFDYDEVTGEGDMEGLYCEPCSEFICSQCDHEHMASAEHAGRVKDDADAKAEEVAQATLKRKRQEEPEFLVKRAKLESQVAAASEAYEASKAATAALQRAHEDAVRELDMHNA